MPEYTVGLGWDVADVDMVRIEPQPQGDAVAPVVRNYGLGGGITEQGSFLCYHWSHVEDEVEYLALLAQFGLDDENTKEVTVPGWSERLVWTKYNALAHYPESGQDMKRNNFFPRDVAIYFVDLEVSEA